MISTWFQNPHVLHRPYNFAQVREVSTPQRRGLSGLYGFDGVDGLNDGLDVTQLPIYTPGVDYTPDMLSSSWAATLSSPSTVARYAGAGIPCGQGINPIPCPGGISPMLVGIGLFALILITGGHSGGRR